MSFFSNHSISKVISFRLIANSSNIVVALVSFCYLIGAIPVSYLLAKYIKGVDIRTYGSGNSGATNASRLLGRPFFLLILFLDACKAYVSLWLINALVSDLSLTMQLYCAAALLVGNAFSVFIGFRGGKGVATSAGLLCFFLPWWLVAAYLGVFLIGCAIGWRVDIGALSGVLGGALIAAASGMLVLPLEYAVWFLAAWIWGRHWQNILYLLGFYTLE